MCAPKKTVALNSSGIGERKHEVQDQNQNLACCVTHRDHSFHAVGILEGVALTWVVNIALQAWGKTAMVPLAWMTLKFLVIAPAMNVRIVTVLIVSKQGDLIPAKQKIMTNILGDGLKMNGDGHV